MYGLRALGALPYTGRPETAVSGALSRYLDSLSSAAIRFATIPNVTFSGDFEVKAVAAQLGAGSNGTFIFAGSGVVGQNGLDLYRNSSGNYQLFINNTSVIGTTTAVTNNITAPDTVIVRRLSGVVDLIINGVSRGTFSTSATLSVERLFHRNGWANNGRMALYEFSVVSGGSYNASWSMANSPSIGALWVSDNNQVLTLSAGWPTDNSQWKQYLDTTVSTPIVNQGVNGTANYFCTLNGTSGFTSPTLGDLITGSLKIKITSKKFSTPTNGTYALYSQCGSTSSSREFVFRTNANGNIELFIGGSSTYICTVAEAITAFGNSTLACEEFAFELNGTTARLFKDGVAVITKTGVARGTTRINNALFRIGNQGATDSPLDTTGTAFAANGTTIGDTQIHINDVLVRNYKMPDNGSTVIDTVAGNNLTQRGTFTIDNSEWRQFVVFNAAPQNPDKVVTTMMTTKIRTASPILAMKVGINSRVTFARSSTLFTATKIVPLAIQTSSRTQSTSVRSKIGLSSGTTRARTKSTNVVYKVTSGAVVTRGRTKTTSSASKVLVKQSQTLGRAKSTFNLQKSALVAVLVKTKGLSTTAQSKSTQVGGSSRSVVFSTAQAKKSINSSALSQAFTSAETSAMKGAIVAGFSVAKALAEFTYFNPANAIPPKFISISTNATTTFDLSTSAHLTTTIITLRKTTHDY